MNPKKLLTTIAIVTVVLIVGCKKDDFIEVVGVCPVVESTNPTNAANGVPLNQIITATFNEKMNPVTITQASFIVQSYDLLSTSKGYTFISGIVSYTDSTASFEPFSLLAPNTSYKGIIASSVRDLMGNSLQADYEWTFNTDIWPTVISTDPVNGAINVIHSKIIRATFSEPMNPQSINTSTFTLKSGSTQIFGTVSYYNSTASFTPVSDLLSGITYTATLSNLIENNSGTPMEANYEWSFTVLPPQLTCFDPADNATEVVLNKIVSVCFSEPMDPASINESTFTLKHGTTSVTGTVSYLNSIAYFEPSINLQAGTTYTATITTGMQNLSGITLYSEHTWNFSTVPSASATSIGLQSNIEIIKVQ